MLSQKTLIIDVIFLTLLRVLEVNIDFSTCHCVYSCLFDVKSKILLDLASSGCRLKKKIGWEFYYFVYGFNIKGSNPRWPPVLKMYNLHILCWLKWIAANVLPISMQLVHYKSI